MSEEKTNQKSSETPYAEITLKLYKDKILTVFNIIDKGRGISIGDLCAASMVLYQKALKRTETTDVE